MQYVKTFEFLISNQYGNAVFSNSGKPQKSENEDEDLGFNYKTGNYVRSNVVTDPEECDAAINDFWNKLTASDKTLIFTIKDIKINLYTVKRFNSQADWVIARYTLIYETEQANQNSDDTINVKIVQNEKEPLLIKPASNAIFSTLTTVDNYASDYYAIPVKHVE